MTTAPIVMPEVITGLSLLLLFVAMEQLIGWPQRGRCGDDHAGAHHLLHGLRDRGGAVAPGRLRRVARGGGDGPGRPARARCSCAITLPLILPAIASGWLLAFTLSWDDLVITQFVAGPGSSTLPMVIFSKVRFGVTPGRQRARHHHGAAGGDRHRHLHGVDALPAEAARARPAARRRRQPVSANVHDTAQVLGIDVGGSSVKAGLVDVDCRPPAPVS